MLNVDIEFSREMKKKHKHKVGRCYENAFRLWQKKETNAYVIGLCTTRTETSKEKVLIRHGWCVKEDLIVDSTLGYAKEDFKDIEYFPIFKFETASDMKQFMLNTSGYDGIGYNSELETREILRVTNDTGLRYYEVRV